MKTDENQIQQATKHLEIKGEQIPYLLKKSKSRRLKLSFSRAAGILHIESATGELDADIMSFIQEKANWISKQYKKQNLSADKQHFFEQQLEAGKLLFLGKEIDLSFQVAAKRSVRREADHILIRHLARDTEMTRKNLVYAALKSLAKSYLHQRCMELAIQTQSQINQIRVKDLKSKWGSCSGKRNINLNFYLILLPQDLVDYIIIHELMHLRQMNHSPAFWAEVAKYCPTYQAKRKEVRAFSWVIGLFTES